MSSFFTLPKSSKRKRDEDAPKTAKKRIRAVDAARTQNPRAAKARKSERDESISGSDSEEEEPRARNELEDVDDSSQSESGGEDETATERRRRLAERYLDNIKEQVQEVGFDAAEIDRDLIAERLKEDVAETKGRLYRKISDDYDFSGASKTQFRADTLCTTSVAVCLPYAYTVSKDITLIKWGLAMDSKSKSVGKNLGKKNLRPVRKRPTKLLYSRGSVNKANEPGYQHHTAAILCVAASSDGKFVVTGGADKKIIVWSAPDLTPLRVFNQHRDAVTSLAFRRGTNQLYSSSKDRTVKTWSLNELAYVETLFGHQDEVADVTALSQERCISVGARDRTARLWKVVEETQLVFRGGGGEKKSKSANPGAMFYAEGSIDRVAMIDEDMFVTGSDNGSLSLWTMHKKKPVFTLPLAHGVDPALKPDEAFAEENPPKKVPSPPEPRWITALTTIPYSDLIISGSWDGHVRVWKVSEDKKRIEAVASVTQSSGKVLVRGGNVMRMDQAGEEDEKPARGVVNDVVVFEKGDRGKDGLCIVAAVGTEHRLGRWKKFKGKNGAMLFEISKFIP